MSYGSLPPLPGLIPISALRKTSINSEPRECTPCPSRKEVMGEQRSRRTGYQPSVQLVDIARRSRGYAATSQAPSGKTDHRHRKSDRRREHKGGRKRSASKRRDASSAPAEQEVEEEEVAEEEERCVNPRVNPIFVWVRQENSRIVDVKCEDYDKRNRIVLTKTAQGWRAIPRTETLAPNLKAAAALEEEEEAARQQHNNSRKLKKTHKVKRKSTAVQVDEGEGDQEQEQGEEISSWDVPINIESHLPSHTIQVQKRDSPSPDIGEIVDSESVNTTLGHDDYNAQVSPAECSASKVVCDVSPLDNLLAVAEFEFNQQIETETWCDKDEDKMGEDKQDNDELPIISSDAAFDSDEDKEEDCDYNEEDENNAAMVDILTRLEQSLQSPEGLSVDLHVSLDEGIPVKEEEQEERPRLEIPDESLTSYNFEDFLDYKDSDVKDDNLEIEHSDVSIDRTEEQLVTPQTEDKPTDLSTTNKVQECLSIKLPEEDLLPTDLSLPKNNHLKGSIGSRPSSRSSETIQSPQPSGLPAVPHSPDVPVSSKSAFLESLLSSASQKLQITSTKQNDPIDFGKCRKSASPTVTCSEEVNSSSGRDGEPEPKKPKLDDITLRKILDANTTTQTPPDKNANRDQPKNSRNPETSRLLELLTTESESDPLTQFKQLISDCNASIPDPLLIPKDRLSLILTAPGKEIPRLLNQRPELKLPEALNLPHLLQDPDILVITLLKLETIIRKQCLPSEKKLKSSPNVKKPDLKPNPDKATPKLYKEASKPTNKDAGRIGEFLNNDANMSNNMNNLNQMMWLPYLQQLEVAAMAFGGGPDFLKMLTTALPPYSTQIPDIPQLFSMNRFAQPAGFPIPSAVNPFEFPVWHDAGRPNLQRSASQFERGCNKSAYRDYMEKMTRTHQKYLSTKNQPYSAYQANNNNNNAHASLHNLPHSLMTVPPPYQHSSLRHNLQVPQYNNNAASNVQSQKSGAYSRNNGKVSPSSSSSSSSVGCDSKMSSFNSVYNPSNRGAQNQRYNNSYNQKSNATSSSNNNNNNNNNSNASSAKLIKSSTPSSSTSTSFATLESISKNLLASPQDCFKRLTGASDFLVQPMDLSGSTIGGGGGAKSKLGNKQQQQGFCRGVVGDGLAKSLRLEDVPEVGSTTASIEDMTAHIQESQKHLWHPLFGNQKSSSNPWNWTTVTATGE